MAKSPVPGEYRKNWLNESVLGPMDLAQVSEGKVLIFRINQVPFHFFPLKILFKTASISIARHSLLGSCGRWLRHQSYALVGIWLFGGC